MGGEILINREQIDNLLTHIRERNLAPTKPLGDRKDAEGRRVRGTA